MEEIYAITDIDGYASQMREAAANLICDNYNDNLDNYITISEIITLVNDECLGYDSENRPLLDENVNEKIFENTVSWINSIGLAKLAADDLVECAWDDENNEMVFWSKEKKQHDTKIKRKSRRKNPKNKGSDC